MTAFDLPGQLGGIEFGRLDDAPVQTQHGLLQVETMGYEIRVGRLRASWSRPRRVTVTRADGLAETAPVQDGAGRVILTLCAAAVSVAAVSFAISRR